MNYFDRITLKDGRECILRNGTENDAEAVLEIFALTHAQTDFLLTYPDEKTFTLEEERDFLKRATENDDEIEIIAILDGKIVGSAGIYPIGRREKIKHRADLGISVDKQYWGLGIGGALMGACIECAKKAGFLQVELDVVGTNTRAMGLYKKFGFTEFGRNPMGFKSRYSGFMDLVQMRLELK